MKLDLKEWINKITSRKPVYEYVGNMSSYVFNSSWTATDDGVAIVRATWDTTGAFGYWYINDTTDNIQVCNLGGTSNGTSLSAMIPIIKGHSYANAGSAHVYYAFFQFYKMKWGGVLLNSILKAFSHFASSKGGGVDESRYKGIGGETARLFLQTCHKRKLDIQRISEWLSRSVVLWLEHTLFGRKHKYSLATHSAEDYCFEWGRDNKWNCARTIGKSLGFIFKECLHNFQRIGDNIRQTWSVCGLYESVTISERGCVA